MIEDGKSGDWVLLMDYEMPWDFEIVFYTNLSQSKYYWAGCRRLYSSEAAAARVALKFLGQHNSKVIAAMRRAKKILEPADANQLTTKGEAVADPFNQTL